MEAQTTGLANLTHADILIFCIAIGLIIIIIELFLNAHRLSESSNGLKPLTTMEYIFISLKGGFFVVVGVVYYLVMTN